MDTDLNKLAKEIIEQNQYMTIATCDKENNAWVSPVVYAYDKDYHFYFVTIPDSKHGKHIKENEQESFAIFDSHQNIGEGIGLQIKGIVKELEIKDIPPAAAIYFKRNYPYRKIHSTFDIALKKLLKGKIYRFYKVTPTKIWMNNPNSNIDERVEVFL